MKILFIGNSHTYMNDMPQLVKEMVENVTGESCDVFMLAYSARSLKWHMGEEYFSERFNILHGKYDYCVMQEQAHPMTDEADTIEYAARIVEMCKKAGTVPVVFETWAEKAKPENQAEMNRRYHNLAKEQGALLAPVGEVWSKVAADIETLGAFAENKEAESSKKNAGTDLYWQDGAHASALGAFVTAMVLTKTITGKFPSEDFSRSYDFTIPGENWFPVNENIEDEVVEIGSDIAESVRKNVNLVTEAMK